MDLKPGEKAPASGQYGVFGPRGGYKGKEVTGIKNKKLPPTKEKGWVYRLVDGTDNESGKI